MEKFNLKRAENGDAVCLGDGTPVKILDFDYQGKILYKYNCQRRDGNVEEKLGLATKEGEGLHEYGVKDGIELYMAPKYAYATIYENEISHELYSGKLCQTPEEAEMQKDKIYPEMKKFKLARIEFIN